MVRRRPHFWLVWSILPLCAALGCASLFNDGEVPFDLRRKIPWRTDDDYEKQPDRLIAIWSQDVLNVEGQKSQRGFGGRLMFYSGANGKAKKVKGQIAIYAYDLSKPPSPTNAPDRKYVFTEEQLKKLHQKNQLGDSYNVWLPWDDVGGPTTTIKLIARFEPAEDSDAKPVVSEATENRLPGVDAPKNPAAPIAFEFNPQQGVIQQTVMHAPSPVATPDASFSNLRPSANDAPGIRMQTTTISMGPRLGQGAVAQALQATQPAPVAQAWGRPDAAPVGWGPANPFGVTPVNYTQPAPGFYPAAVPPNGVPTTFNMPGGYNAPAAYGAPAGYGSPGGYGAPNPYAPPAMNGAAPAHYGALHPAGAPGHNAPAASLPGTGETASLPGTGSAANAQYAQTWGAAQPATGRPLMRPRQMGGTLRSASASQTAVPPRQSLWGNGT